MSQPLPFRSKKELAYATLRDRILSGQLPPGARLIIDDLAAALGVSAIPVREALQQLQADGFVTSEPHVGARVTPLDVDMIQEVFVLLEALEVISGRAAAQKMDEVGLAQMADHLRRMDGLLGDLERWSQENAGLHRFLCQQAGTPLVESLMQKVLEHWGRLRRHFLEGVFARRAAAAQREHWEMLAALRTHDPDRVEAVIRNHNQAALAAYRAHLQATRQVEAGLLPNPTQGDEL